MNTIRTLCLLSCLLLALVATKAQNPSYYWRNTHYSFHPNVTARTYDVRLGLMYNL